MCFEQVIRLPVNFRRFVPVILLTFVNSVGFSILIPVFPLIVEQYGVGALAFGVLLATYSISQFLAAPLLGRWSDRVGRRPVLLLSQAGTLVSWLVFGAAYFLPDVLWLGYALPLWVILLSRVLDGLTGGNVSVVNAFLSDVTSPEERTKYFGMLGAVMGLGFLFGPALGGLSSSTEMGYLGTMLLSIGLSTLTLSLMVFFLPESLPPERRRVDPDFHWLQEINIIQKLLERGRDPVVGRLFWLRGWFYFALASYTTTYVLYAQETFALSTVDFAVLLTVIGLFVIVNQGVLTPLVARRLGDMRTFFLGQVILVISLLLVLTQPALVPFMLIAFVTTVGYGFSMPTFKSLITSRVSRFDQGAITGLDESLLAFNNGIGPVVSGFLYGWLSYWSYGLFAAYLLIPHVVLWIWAWLRKRPVYPGLRLRDEPSDVLE